MGAGVLARIPGPARRRRSHGRERACIAPRSLMRACTLFLLIALIFPLSAAWGKDRIISDYYMTNYRNSGPVTFSPETYEGLEQLRHGHADKAYSIWVEQGFQGDIEALALAAMLCKGEEIQPTPDWKMHWGDNSKGSPAPACPVPARFWEESMIKMLGEGEGTFLLGLFGTELMEYDPFRKGTVYIPPIEAYMLRSALTGHPDGMFGAYLTSDDRSKEHFTPPQNAPEVPVIPERFSPKISFEGRYWMSRSAHAGNLDAMQSMAEDYQGNPPAVPPDVAQVEKYQAMAVAGGSHIAAGIFGRMYAKGSILPQNCAKAVYYCAIDARFEGQGNIVWGDDEKHPQGNLVHIMKEGFMEGSFFLADKQVVFKPCLTEAEFNDAVKRSKPAYEAAKAARDKDQAAHDALYEAARKKLPEIKAAYEAAVRERQEGKK